MPIIWPYLHNYHSKNVKYTIIKTVTCIIIKRSFNKKKISLMNSLPLVQGVRIQGALTDDFFHYQYRVSEQFAHSYRVSEYRAPTSTGYPNTGCPLVQSVRIFTHQYRMSEYRVTTSTGCPNIYPLVQGVRIQGVPVFYFISDWWRLQPRCSWQLATGPVGEPRTVHPLRTRGHLS